MMPTNNLTPKHPTGINQAQELLLDAFAGGDHAPLLQNSSAEDLAAELSECGSGLLRFLLKDFSEAEGCFSYETALERIRGSIHEMQALEQVFESKLS